MTGDILALYFVAGALLLAVAAVLFHVERRLTQHSSARQVQQTAEAQAALWQRQADETKAALHACEVALDLARREFEDLLREQGLNQSAAQQLVLWQERAEEYRAERDACESQIAEAVQVQRDLFRRATQVEAELDRLRLLQPEAMEAEILRLREELEGAYRNQHDCDTLRRERDRLRDEVRLVTEQRDAARKAFEAVRSYQQMQHVQDAAGLSEHRVDPRAALEASIQRTYTLMDEYRELIRLESDPKQQASYRKDLAAQDASIRDQLRRYLWLCQEQNLPALDPIADIASILGIDL